VSLGRFVLVSNKPSNSSALLAQDRRASTQEATATALNAHFILGPVVGHKVASHRKLCVWFFQRAPRTLRITPVGQHAR
jgi:hypothetical protein